jgi:hypothetical protein
MESMSDAEILQMFREAGKTGLVAKSRGKLSENKSYSKASSGVIREQAESLLNELVSAGTRDEAAEILAKWNPSRALILQAARIRELHIRKEDTNAALREKLVENIVGARLDSAAIRGD